MHPKVAAVLNRQSITFKVHRHDQLPLPVESPADFAAQLGYELARITKTLLVRATTGDERALVVSPMGRKIDFKAVAELLKVKRVQVASPAELHSLTKYPERGVSPLGNQGISVLMDESLLGFDTVLIGAGEVGVEIEIGPQDLLTITGAVKAPLSIAAPAV